MKKFYFLLAVLPLLYSCYQEYEELDSFLNEKVDQINTCLLYTSDAADEL